LDFQLPIRFDLNFRNAEDKDERPVIIHRAILGSVERFMAILIEHTGGKWPFWLSPRQAIVVTVAEGFVDYAKEVHQKLWDAGFDCDMDLSDNTLNKKVREGQLAQYNFILVVGQREVENKVVNVRTRDNTVHGERSLDVLIAEFSQLVKEHK
jgi:threonyl-tRNA synthetase